jgi:glycosyltransferase involved in cell wall biosynthesis
MTKILYYGESPCIETGLAQVSKNHLSLLSGMGFDIEAVCINHHPALANYDKVKYPYTIHAQSDPNEPYNRDKMKQLILAGDYDIILLSADCGNLDVFMDHVLYMRGQKRFKLITYVPVDCDIIGSEVFRCMTASDYSATYSYHAQRVLKRLLPIVDVDVIYLGCEPNLFYPMGQEERRRLRKERLFGIDDETFVVTMCDRNQWRKDLARAMFAFHQFHLLYPNSLLYINAKQVDVGGPLNEYARVFDMYWDKADPLSGLPEVCFTPPIFNESFGIDRKDMNNIYNFADAFIKSSTGEGWGLTTTESMAAGCPVIVPNNTSNVELVGKNEERGYLVECGGMDLWLMPYGLTCNPRDICSVKSMVNKLEDVYLNRTEAKVKAMRAREWTELYTWADFKHKWEAVLNQLCETRAVVPCF